MVLLWMELNNKSMGKDSNFLWNYMVVQCFNRTLVPTTRLNLWKNSLKIEMPLNLNLIEIFVKKMLTKKPCLSIENLKAHIELQ